MRATISFKQKRAFSRLSSLVLLLVCMITLSSSEIKPFLPTPELISIENELATDEINELIDFENEPKSADLSTNLVGYYPFDEAISEKESQYQEVRTGLVGHWNFDNSPSDTSNNNNHATLAGSPGYAGAIKNEGINLYQASGQYAEIAHSSSIDIRRTISFSFWFYLEGTVSDWTPVFAKMDNVGTVTTRTYALFLNSGLYWHFTTADSSAQDAMNAPTGSIVLNTWQHWTFTIDRYAGTMRIYRDGALLASSTATITDTASHTNPLTINKPSGYTGANFRIDEVRLFNRVLRDAEISTLYNYQDNKRIHESLIGHWTFDKSASDSSMSQNHATLANNPSYITARKNFGLQLGYSPSTYVEIPNSASLDIRRTITFSFWFYLQEIGGQWTPIFLKTDESGSVTTRTYALFMESDGKMVLTSSDSTGQEAASTTAGSVILNTWQHWTFVIDRYSGSMRIYLNGGQVSSAVVRQTDTISHSNPLTINKPRAHQAARFQIDDVRLYNRVLPVQEISALFSAPRTTNIRDFSGKGNHGIQTGEYWVPDGVIGGATQFNGDGPYQQFITIPSTNYIQIHNEMSWGCWIKVDEFVPMADSGAFFWKEGEYGFRTQASGAFVAYTYDTGASQWRAVSASGYSTNTWYHVMAVRSGTSLSIYINGQLINSINTIQATTGTTSPLEFGRQGTWTGFIGLMDETRIYNRGLSPEEVKNLAEFDSLAMAPWWSEGSTQYDYRFDMTVKSSLPTNGFTANVPINFTDQLSNLRLKGTLDPSTVKLVKYDPRSNLNHNTATIVTNNPISGYNAYSNAIRELSWNVDEPFAYELKNPYEGFIRDWLMLGSFNTVSWGGSSYPDQIDMGQIYQEGQISAGLTWGKYTSPQNTIDLQAIWALENVAMYATTYVYFPEDVSNVYAFIGSDDGVRFFFDGGLRHDNHVGRGVTIDQDKVSIGYVSKGWHRVMIMIENGGGPWGYCFRFSSNPSSFVEIPNLKIATAYYPPLSGFIRDWNLLGPVSTGGWWSTTFTADPFDTSQFYRKGEKAGSYTWNTFNSGADYVDQNTKYGGDPDVCVGYAQTYVYFPQDVSTVYAFMGSDDGIKLIVDGKNYPAVHDNHVLRGSSADADKVSIGPLSKGWHSFLVMTEESTGGWGFHFRLSSDSQNYVEIPNLQVSSTLNMEDQAIYFVYFNTTNDESQNYGNNYYSNMKTGKFNAIDCPEYVIGRATYRFENANKANFNSAPWWAEGTSSIWRFRANINISALALNDYNDHLIELPINFTPLMSGSPYSGAFDENSIRIVEWDDYFQSYRSVLIPYQFDKDGDYNAASKASGTLSWVADGKTTESRTRYYFVYFDTTALETKTAPSFSTGLSLTLNAANDYTVQNNKIRISMKEGVHTSYNDHIYEVYDKRTSKDLQRSDTRWGWMLYHWSYGGGIQEPFDGVTAISVIAQGQVSVKLKMTFDHTNFLYERFYTLNYLDDTIKIQHNIQAKVALSQGTWITASWWNPGRGDTQYTLPNSAYGIAGGMKSIADSTVDGSDQFTLQEELYPTIMNSFTPTTNAFRREAWYTHWDENLKEGIGTIWDTQTLTKPKYGHVSQYGYGLSGWEGLGIYLIIKAPDLSMGQSFSFMMWGHIYSGVNGFTTKARANGLQTPITINTQTLANWNFPVPTNPTGFSSQSHTANVWSNNDIINMILSGASSGGIGFIAGYSYEINQVSNTNVDTVLDTTSSTLNHDTLGVDGDWYIHVRTKNEYNYWSESTTHFGPFRIDTVNPTNPNSYNSPSHVVGTATTINIIEISWSGAFDATSGIQGYSYSWTTNPSSIPDTTIDTTGTSAISAALANGLWYFHIITCDNAGNWNNSEAFHVGPFVIGEGLSLSDEIDKNILINQGLSLYWTVSDTLPGGGTYNITRNSVVIQQGSWNSNDMFIVSINSGSLLAGTYIYVCSVANGFSEYKSDTATVIIRNPAPIFSLQPGNTTNRPYGASNLNIVWQFSDTTRNNSAYYNVTENGFIIKENTAWGTGVIEYSFIFESTKNLGTYDYVVSVFDGFGNYSFSYVSITVINNLPTIIVPSNMSQAFGTTGTPLTWTINDDSIINTPNCTIYLDGIYFYSKSWSKVSNLVTITIPNDLPIGSYNFTLEVDDGFGANVTSAAMNVLILNGAPVLQTPASISQYYGTSGTLLRWNITDLSVTGTLEYSVLQNGTIVQFGTWTTPDGTIIFEIPDNLLLNVYNYSLELYDGYDNFTLGQVLVTILNVAPNIEAPADFSQPFGTMGTMLRWNLTDSTINPPGLYSVYQQSEIVQTGQWNSGSTISFEINENLLPGQYQFRLIVFDGYGNFTIGIMVVTILNNLPVFNSIPEAVAQYFDTPGTRLAWNATDDTILGTATYILRRNSTNGYIQIDAGNWVPNVNITYLIPADLAPGHYYFNLTIFDGYGGTLNAPGCSVIITPRLGVSHPSDITNYVEGSTGNVIVWIGYDLFPDTYLVYLGGELRNQSTWINAQPITINIDGLLKGVYEFRIVVNNTSNDIEEDIVFVYVLDKTAPTITSPGNRVLQEGFVDFLIEWTFQDNYPNNYSYYLNGQWVGNGTWSNLVGNNSISFHALNLIPGIYTFTVYVWDESNNRRTEILKITVENAIPTLTALEDIVLEQGFPYILSWIPDNDWPVNPQYQIFRNITLVASGSWAAGVPITFNLTNLAIVGYFNIKLVITDGSGAEVQDTVLVQTINILPQVELITSLEFPYGTSIVFNVTDYSVLGIGYYEFLLDGVKWTSGGWFGGANQLFTMDTRGIKAGNYTITFNIDDNYGTAYSISNEFKILPAVIPPPEDGDPPPITPTRPNQPTEEEKSGINISEFLTTRNIIIAAAIGAALGAGVFLSKRGSSMTRRDVPSNLKMQYKSKAKKSVNVAKVEQAPAKPQATTKISAPQEKFDDLESLLNAPADKVFKKDDQNPSNS